MFTQYARNCAGDDKAVKSPPIMAGYFMECIMLVEQRESWIKQWESGDVPTYAHLGLIIGDDIRQEWRDNWQSEGWRMAKGMEMLCSWLEWRDKKPA